MEIYGLTLHDFLACCDCFWSMLLVEFLINYFCFRFGSSCVFCLFCFIGQSRYTTAAQRVRATHKNQFIIVPDSNWWLDNAWNSRHLPSVDSFVCRVLFCLNINAGWFHCCYWWLSYQVRLSTKTWPFQRASTNCEYEGREKKAPSEKHEQMFNSFFSGCSFAMYRFNEVVKHFLRRCCVYESDQKHTHEKKDSQLLPRHEIYLRLFLRHVNHWIYSAIILFIVFDWLIAAKRRRHRRRSQLIHD